MTIYLPVLTFHSIDDRPSAISFSPKLFQRGMAKLHEKGYQTLSLMKTADCLRRGVPFPEHSLVITFDDGYQTVYDQAFPVLQRYGMSATVFLTVGAKGATHSANRLPSLEARSMLAWYEIREMQRWGIEFGAHTLTHPDLTRLPLEQVELEICKSKKILEDALGTEILCFSYPHGRFNHQSYEIVRHHFDCACSVKLGLVTLSSELYTLERVDAYYYLRKIWLFDLMWTRLFPWYIRTRSIPLRIRRAFSNN